ncbi:MAG: hypothetical protein ABSA92_12320 [Candidatus Bathyarchaeia archaeon]
MSISKFGQEWHRTKKGGLLKTPLVQELKKHLLSSMRLVLGRMRMVIVMHVLMILGCVVPEGSQATKRGVKSSYDVWGKTVLH